MTTTAPSLSRQMTNAALRVPQAPVKPPRTVPISEHTQPSGSLEEKFKEAATSDPNLVTQPSQVKTEEAATSDPNLVTQPSQVKTEEAATSDPKPRQVEVPGAPVKDLSKRPSIISTTQPSGSLDGEFDKAANSAKTADDVTLSPLSDGGSSPTSPKKKLGKRDREFFEEASKDNDMPDCLRKAFKSALDEDSA